MNRRPIAALFVLVAASPLAGCRGSCRPCCPPAGVAYQGAAVLEVEAAAAPAAPATAAKPAEPPAMPPGADAEMMKKWMEMSAPGPNHKWLGGRIGTWETTTKMWMGPGQATPETKGTATVRWLSEGRWLAEEAKGEMMGMPFHGFGTTGYDNFKKKFVFSWVDNLGTALLTGEGELDASGTVMTCLGLMDEPLTGERDKKVKYVTRLIDANTVVFEIHDLAIGEPNTKVIEVTYKRQ